MGKIHDINGDFPVRFFDVKTRPGHHLEPGSNRGCHPSRPSTAPATSAAPPRRSSVLRATRCARAARRTRTWRPRRRRRRCRSSGSPGCPGDGWDLLEDSASDETKKVSLMMKLRLMAGCSIFFFSFLMGFRS